MTKSVVIEKDSDAMYLVYHSGTVTDFRNWEFAFKYALSKASELGFVSFWDFSVDSYGYCYNVASMIRVGVLDK